LALLESIQRHPLRAIGLISGAVAGSALAYFLLPEEISSLRRVLGGGLLGGLSWFIVSFGSLIDGDH